MSNYNPYAYTPAPPVQLATPVPGAPMPWAVGDVIGHAWRAFKPEWATLVFTQFLASILGGIPNYAPGILVAAETVEIYSTEYWLIYTVCMLLGLVASTFFTAGMMKMWLAATRGQKPQFADMFSGGSHFLPLLGTTFLTLLVVALGYVLLIVPGIILALGLGFAGFYVVDQRMGPVDAMKASWNATKGHKGQIFLFGLVALLMVVGGYLACCIGVFVAIPVIMVAWTTIYTRISGTAGDAGGGMSPPPHGFHGGPPSGGNFGPYGPPGGGFGGPSGYGPPPPGGFGGAGR
jgi:uncharacterized membrane protein